MLDITLPQVLIVLKHCSPWLQADGVHSALADDVVQSIKGTPSGVSNQPGVQLRMPAEALPWRRSKCQLCKTPAIRN